MVEKEQPHMYSIEDRRRIAIDKVPPICKGTFLAHRLTSSVKSRAADDRTHVGKRHVHAAYKFIVDVSCYFQVSSSKMCGESQGSNILTFHT